MDFQGRVVAVGGTSNRGTSIYDPVAGTWSDGGVSLVSLFTSGAVSRLQHASCRPTLSAVGPL